VAKQAAPLTRCEYAHILAHENASPIDSLANLPNLRLFFLLS
jgi:hypothetical protein